MKRPVIVDEGRGLDLRIGRLTGEAGEVTVRHPDEAYPLPRDGEGLAHVEEPGGLTYHGQPSLKAPVWKWYVPAYFYAGGVAGAAAALAAASSVSGRGRLDGLVARARWIAATGTAAGSVLLIADLGRPERFLHMMRVVRVSSPMNVGTWILTAAGGAAAVAAAATDWPGGRGGALVPRRSGVRRRLRRVIADGTGLVAGLLGGPLAAYTGVLLASTAVPAWQGARRSLPLLFVGSAMAGAASLLDLCALAPAEAAAVRRFGIAGKVAELVAAEAVHAEAGRAARVGRSFERGVAGGLWRAARALTAVSLGVTLAPGRGRWKRAVAGLLGTAGAIAMRFAVVHAGRASTADPRASFHQQRLGVGAPK